MYFSPGATGRTYGIIFTLPYCFSAIRGTPNKTYLWHSAQYTYIAVSNLFRFGRRSGGVWLFDTFFNRSF
nr:MAG TPA: hypothetical protein [Caudoviricetes sp.]